MAVPAILSFFEPEATWPELHYGDSVALIPDGVNGLAVFSGANDGRPWVEILANGATLPPNLRDCHFRLVPRGQYNEAKFLAKLKREGTWDEGRNLALPDPPGAGANLDALAAAFCKAHGLGSEALVKEMYTRLHLAAEEREGNRQERDRLQGLPIRYLDTVELQHVTTGKTLNLTKQQAYERAAKRVACLDDGSAHAVWVVQPAFKAYAAGEVVGSGDLVVLTTQKRVGGMSYSLHMGRQHGQDERTVVKRSLQVKNPVVTGAMEVNATTGDSVPTAWRMVMFQRYQHSPLNATRFKAHAQRFCAEQIVCFYHKDAEAYLDYRSALGDHPVFRASNRVAVKSRKKASWMWKIESLLVFNAGGHVVCNDTCNYRIKHVVTNRYLIQNGPNLEMTDDYLADGTTFTFRPFAKNAADDFVNNLSLVYLRSSSGWAVQQVPQDHVGGAAGGAAEGLSGMDLHKETRVALSKQETGTERDAMLVMPVLHGSVTSVIQIRRAMLVLRDYQDLLESVDRDPDAPDCLAEGGAGDRNSGSMDSWLAGVVRPAGKPRERKLSVHAEPVRPPDVLPANAQATLRHTAACYKAVRDTLCTLVLNATFDEDLNPLSRDGPPNRLMQKLLRELEAIPVVMKLVQLPFTRGINIRWMAAGDPRLAQLLEIITLMYRLMKQTVKEDETNAIELHNYVGVIRAHQGKGLSATVTLKELYMGKRFLLQKIQPDLVRLFVRLLQEERDPRYIDFLMSVCTCGIEPMPAIQKMICSELFEKNPELLPIIQLDRRPGAPPRLSILVPGSKTEEGADLWMDAADFNDSNQVNGRDLASHILTADVGSLTEPQRMFRYFTRISNMCGKVSLGRNQAALGFLLRNKNLCFSYEDLIAILKEESIPTLTRARFTSLMIRLFVDRDPQSSKPQVLYTRTWSKVVPDKSDFAISHAVATGATLPVCTNGFVDLCEHILDGLTNLGGAVDEDGRPSLNQKVTYGQLELILAQIEMCDTLIDFGFFTTDRDSINVNFEQVRGLFKAVFNIVDTRGYKCAPSKRREALMLIALRSEALKLLIRMLNLRANYRISVMLDSWESFFETLQAQTSFKPLSRDQTQPSFLNSFSLDSSLDGSNFARLATYSAYLESRFAPFKQEFEHCVDRCFATDIISTPDIRADQYRPGEYRGDAIVEAMINLMGFRDSQLTAQACALMIRHMAQRTRVTEDLKLVQVLVTPEAVRVYHETEYAIKVLTALKKHLSADRKEAYEEAEILLKRVTTYITLSADNLSEIVGQNQKIMLNRELDEPVVDLLRLNLERDLTRRAACMEEGEMDADPPVNPQRRDLFQSCYDFLLMLCKNNANAQMKLFPLISVFQDHVGIEKLNVADTICEIVRDNPRLISQVPESLFRHFIDAILTWGRKARWLRFFEVFLEVQGSPLKRNQDLLLRMVLDDFDKLIDLECDYRASRFLPRSDPRTGKTRLELIRDGDHRWKVRSLVKYHFSSVNLLALCAAGKNAVNQARVMMMVSVDTIVDNVIECALRPDMVRESDPEFDWDGVYYVRKAWTKLLTNVYLTSLDTHSTKQLQDAKRIWVPQTSEPGGPGEPLSLMNEYVVDMQTLTVRLKDVKRPPADEEGDGDCEGMVLAGLRDSIGWDIGQHLEYVVEVLRSVTRVILRQDIFDAKDEVLCLMASELRESAVYLYKELHRLGRHTEALLCVELVNAMTERGITGAAIRLEEEGIKLEKEKGVEARFMEGWRDFKLHVGSTYLGVEAEEGRTMIGCIKDMAKMLGSRKSFQNDELQTLGEFIRELASEQCDPLVQLNGLRVVRAVLYIQPDRESTSLELQEKEYQRMLHNQPPSDAEKGFPSFVAMQRHIATRGGVDLIVTCMSSPETDIVLAALYLAVTILEGGNKAVQDLFAEILTPASSQSFFMALHKVMENGVTSLKAQKKTMKQRQAEKHALAAAGIVRRSMKELPSLGPALQFMTEVMKMMRRFCLGQHTALQDILRKQRLNKVSVNFFDEAVNYLIALEPELKYAIKHEDLVTVEGAIRGFLMLADAMRGPNPANQVTIATKGFFELVDRLMNKTHFEPNDERRNALRSRLKSAVATCLMAFLEGVEGNAIPEQMLTSIDWPALAGQMNVCYEAMLKEEPRLLPREALCEEGIIYFFTLRFIKYYDRNNDHIAPAWHKHLRAVRFFESRTGYVEIVRDGRLERCFFMLPDSCIPGGPLDKPFEEMYETEREDPDRKNAEFLDNMIRLIEREERHSSIRQTWLSFTVTHFEAVCQACFVFAVSTHWLMILGAYVPRWQREQEVCPAQEEPPTEWDVWFEERLTPNVNWLAVLLTLALAALACVRALSFVHAELPRIISEGLESETEEEVLEDDVEDEAPEEAEQEDEANLVFSATARAAAPPADLAVAAEGDAKGTEGPECEGTGGPPLLSQAWVVLSSPWCWYEACHLASALLAVVLWEPTVAFWPLLEMCFWKGSRTVIDAIKFNAGKMIQTFLLGLLVMYIWLLFGMWMLYDQHAEDMCTNMFQCFSAYFYLTMRGDGVKDVMTDESFARNIVDFAVEGNMLVRTVWDMTYQFVFLYILIAIITGIVIDAFGGLRDEREEAEDNLKTSCFVCNLDRFTLDQKGSGFDKHVAHEHNPRNYFFFLLHIKMAPRSKLTSQESYVRDKVWPTNPRHGRSYGWLPREKTLSLTEGEEEDEQLHAMVEKVVDQRLAATEARLLSAIAALGGARRGGPV